jgi:MFS family permease
VETHTPSATAPRSRLSLLYVGLSGALLDLGNALADSRTVVPMFITRLSASAVAVGAVETIRGIGFFLPQLLVAHRAQGKQYRKPLYLAAAATRAGALLLIAVAIFALGGTTGTELVIFLLLWTVFALSVGAAQAPYTDIVARVVPAGQRSRLLGGRGLVGGIWGVGAGFAVRHQLSDHDVTITAYALVFVVAATVFACSALAFAFIAEPPVPATRPPVPFRALLADNLATVKRDRRFRMFLVSQILDAAVLAALPFYVVQFSRTSALPEADVGLLLAAHTIGAVGLNPFWGWWGDRYGKLSLLRATAPFALFAPIIAIVLGGVPGLPIRAVAGLYLVIFFLNGACTSGRVVGDLGYLMEISPDDRRAEYSGFLNTWLAPVRLLPVAAAIAEPWISLGGIFAFAAVAATARIAALSTLREEAMPRSP